MDIYLDLNDIQADFPKIGIRGRSVYKTGPNINPTISLKRKVVQPQIREAQPKQGYNSKIVNLYKMNESKRSIFTRFPPQVDRFR